MSSRFGSWSRQRTGPWDGHSTHQLCFGSTLTGCIGGKPLITGDLPTVSQGGTGPRGSQTSSIAPQGTQCPHHVAQEAGWQHLWELCHSPSLFKQRWVDECVASQGIQSRQPLNGYMHTGATFKVTECISKRLLLSHERCWDSWPLEERNQSGASNEPDCSVLLCNKALLKYKRERESFWQTSERGRKHAPC